ncbi:aldo-keto reductase [Fusarium mundagurra]|uniref:Aldo-keto reductase n=1 Tax=Fusarium mundagurra TaxID=1567541 RepID=A0A8H5YIH7_9HYPO|nr:aldo-keto reductase [Fusarium mundagurra]
MGTRGPRLNTLPLFLYGTGSDCDEQDKLTCAAIRQGYTAIDTGPTPAYREELTANGIETGLGHLSTTSAEHLFVQTKISPAGRYQTAESMPFTMMDTPQQQVQKSFERSKIIFSSSGCIINALLLHAPFPNLSVTMEYWNAMEDLIKTDPNLEFLGICNTTLPTLQQVYQNATIKPSIIQNSFRAPSSYDRDIISFCRQNGMVYQAYGVLTSNPALLSSNLIGWFAETNHISEAEALFVFVSAHGSGTVHILQASRDEDHMAADLRCQRLVEKVDSVMIEAFRELLDELSSRSSPKHSWSY